jgi:hypothetical protein
VGAVCTLVVTVDAMLKQTEEVLKSMASEPVANDSQYAHLILSFQLSCIKHARFTRVLSLEI